MDMCARFKKDNMKMYICEKIKFEHFGSQSHDIFYDHEAKLSRNWHYNWSKFYYFKKNFNYFYALKKSIPSVMKFFFRCLKFKIKNEQNNFELSRAELSGTLNSIFLKKSKYRPYIK